MLEALYNEHHYATLHDAGNKGFGYHYLLARLVGVPFIQSATAAFAHQHGARQIPHWACAAPILVLFGQ